MGAVLSSAYQQSFRLPVPTLTEKNLPDQQGKVFIVTGSNAGVGYQLSKILYGANATVYVAARTESKALAAIESIKKAHPSSQGVLHFLYLDLSDLSTIKASADKFLASESKLDVLWNNAGVMIPPPGSTGAQGHDLQYVTNILGPFLFTKFLSLILAKTAKDKPPGAVRVCWAGSLAVDVSSPTGGAEFNEDGSLNDYDMKGNDKTYGVTKAANFFLGYEFGRRTGTEAGVLHTSFNPGNLTSELQRHAREAWPKVAMMLLDMLLYPTVMGAYTELYGGLSPELSIEKHQGAFTAPWGRIWPVRSDIQAECKPGGKSEKLYEWCERETGKFA